MPDINGIPYVESTDLVSAYPAASQALAQEISDQLASKLDTSAYSPGLTLITANSFSAVSSVSINNCFSATYRNYLVEISATATAAMLLDIRLRVGGSDNSAASYDEQELLVYQTTVAGTQNLNQTAGLITSMGPSSTNAVSMRIYDPFETATTSIMTQSASARNDARVYLHTVNHDDSTSFDGFSLLVNTGTITGILRVYGLAE